MPCLTSAQAPSANRNPRQVGTACALVPTWGLHGVAVCEVDGQAEHLVLVQPGEAWGWGCLGALHLDGPVEQGLKSVQQAALGGVRDPVVQLALRSDKDVGGQVGG